MSAVHTCFRSALTQTFRPSTADVAASWTVPAFLVPACTRPRGRPFSSAKRRSARTEPVQDALEPAPEILYERSAWNIPQNPTKPPLRSCVPVPAQHVRADIQQWLRALDAFLPPHLRPKQPNERDGSAASGFYSVSGASVTASDVAYFLVAAQCYSHDVLSHLGLKEQRWDAVVWIAKKLVGDGKPSAHAPVRLESFALAIPPEQQHLPLSALTNDAIKTQLPRTAFSLPTQPSYNLDELTSIPEAIDPRHRLIKRALGQLWRTLGTIILAAAEDQPEHASTMHRVLEILAHLYQTRCTRTNQIRTTMLSSSLRRYTSSRPKF
jgi:hypothetical protein